METATRAAPVGARGEGKVVEGEVGGGTVLAGDFDRFSPTTTVGIEREWAGVGGGTVCAVAGAGGDERDRSDRGDGRGALR